MSGIPTTVEAVKQAEAELAANPIRVPEDLLEPPWAQITVNSSRSRRNKGVSRIVLEPREALWLVKRAKEMEVPPAKVLQFALRVFDLYLSGQLPSNNDSPGCGDLE